MVESRAIAQLNSRPKRSTKGGNATMVQVPEKTLTLEAFLGSAI